MSEQIKEIAGRIAELREICGYTVQELVEGMSVSAEQYEKYESGEHDIPVSFLYELSHKLNVELTALLTGEDPKLKKYSLVRDGKGCDVERSKQYKYKNLAFNFAHKKAEIFLVTVEPDNSGGEIPLNTHPGHEIDYVLEGEVIIKIGTSELVLKPGDTLYYNSENPHGMKAVGDCPAKFLAVII